MFQFFHIFLQLSLLLWLSFIIIIFIIIVKINLLLIIPIVVIILLASRKHTESDNMDGTGDPPGHFYWPALFCSANPSKAFRASPGHRCSIQMSLSLIVNIYVYLPISSVMWSKKFLVGQSPSQIVQEIAEIEVFTFIWLLPSWTSYEIRNYWTFDDSWIGELDLPLLLHIFLLIFIPIFIADFINPGRIPTFAIFLTISIFIFFSWK